jgi:hypothetical protein
VIVGALRQPRTIVSIFAEVIGLFHGFLLPPKVGDGRA